MLYPSIKYEKSDMEYMLTILKAFVVLAVAAVLDWLVPVKTFVAATLLLVVADLVTGVQAARRRNEAVNSKGLRRSVLKFSMYCVAIIAAHTMQTVYFHTFPLVFGISAYISATELWSILENVGQVTGTNLLSANAVSDLLRKILRK
jgi:phage-related holin